MATAAVGLEPPQVSPERALNRIMADITRPTKLHERRERTCPRVVRRTNLIRFPVKKPGQHGTRHPALPAIRLANPAKPQAAS